MNQPQKRVDMRAQMPETAKWVDAKRQEYGAAHVNECLKRGLAGQPGHFYAVERGHVVGAPFPASHPMDAWQGLAITHGCTFAAFMREPAVQTPASGEAA